MTFPKLPKYLQSPFTLLVFFTLLIVLILVTASTLPITQSDPGQISFGVTFSPRYATYMKLDWKEIYRSILDDLKVKNLRIPTYWDILEPEADRLDFEQTDYLLQEAAKRSVRVILVLGERQPRWPECHIPAWAKKLKEAERKQKILQFIQKVVERYKDTPEVWAWQVENEPLLRAFGEDCDNLDEAFLKEEAGLVKSLSNKKIIMTDSGELGLWTTPMRLSDIFGATLYRRVYDKFFGYITYPALPYLYTLKSNSLRGIFAPNNEKTIVVELQAEPWLKDGSFASPAEQAKVFTSGDFRDYVSFASKTGFEEVYLWGVEWWYFMAAQGYPEYLNFAKTLF